MQVVAVQLNMVWEDKAANHKRIHELLDASEIEPESLIVFPEMFETGFTMNAAVAAQDAERAGETFLKELATKYKSAVLGGVASPLEGEVSRNEAVCFEPEGRELVRYQKQQPFTLSGEDKHYLAGEGHALFQWQGVKIAPFICYDLRFPERFRPAAAEGAELIVVIACWPERRSEHWVRLLQARAIENLACVLGVNRCGEEPGLTFDGRSSAFDHMGACQFECDAQEQVKSTSFDIEETRRWRNKFPALRDMQSGIRR
ncbi:MAG: nitrilase-related carbon-nitrogen hydrolase [Planctomycetota bacterium]